MAAPVTAPSAGLRVVIDPPGDPQQNMDRDEELARQVRAGQAPPTLRIYAWRRPAVSLGRRQNADDLPADLLARKLPLVRRPTGGGAVVHSPDELTYALAVSRELLPFKVGANDLPGAIHRSLRDFLVREGLARPEELTVSDFSSRGPFSLCFNAPVCGDLLLRGKKVAGSALRVWRDGALLQGAFQDFPVVLVREVLPPVVKSVLGT